MACEKKISTNTLEEYMNNKEKAYQLYNELSHKCYSLHYGHTVKALIEMANRSRQLVLAAERDIWAHPEVGYTEWWTNEYLIAKFEIY